MAWISPEIETVPFREVIWWDLLTNTERQGFPTGTTPDWNLLPNGRDRYVQREVERIYGRRVHRNCGGGLELSDNQDGCGKFELRIACKKCGREFLAEY